MSQQYFSRQLVVFCLVAALAMTSMVQGHTMTMHAKLVNVIHQVKNKMATTVTDPIPTRPPQLPSAFNATVTTTVPFIGQVTGPFYFDYDNSRMRTDVSMFGQSQASIAFYNEMVQYDIMLPNGPCQVKKLTDPIYPFIIPPFATFVGFENVNSKNCQHWNLHLSPYIMDFYVSSDSNEDNGKDTYYVVRFTLSTDPTYPIPMNVQMDFENVQVGPQPDSLFSIWKNAGCPVPKPPTYYSVSGYTKNALNGQVIPNIQVSLSYGNQYFKTASDKNGLFTFDKALAGSNIILSTEGFTNAGYLPIKQNISSLSGNINAGTIADLFLSPVIPSGQWRAILSWASSPRDLDLHMMMPNGCHTYFSNKQCFTPQGNATLDHDVRNGFGPETLTLSPSSNAANSEFNYFVYNYSNEASYVKSQALVKIYNSAGFVNQIQIPTSGYDTSARYWKVFKLVIDGSGQPQVKIINTVSQTN